MCAYNYVFLYVETVSRLKDYVRDFECVCFVSCSTHLCLRECLLCIIICYCLASLFCFVVVVAVVVVVGGGGVLLLLSLLFLWFLTM